MEVVKKLKSKNKQNFVEIDDNEVTSSSQNDEIINNNVSYEQPQQQQQQAKKGKNSSKKKKNKHKYSHNNDKVVDDQFNINTQQSKEKQLEVVQVKEKELNIDIENTTDKKHLQSKHTQVATDDDICIENSNLPLNKPFNAPLEEIAKLSTTEATELLNNNDDVDSATLTPRLIVDVSAQQLHDLNKYNTMNNITTSSHEIKTHTDNIHVMNENETNTTSELLDDDYDDDGLLVRFLDEANQIAEAKLAQRRQARVEAREIRMRELERQQKEQEHNADRVFDMHTNITGVGDTHTRTRLTAGIGSLSINSVLNATRANSMCSRRSSEDSLEEEGRSLRDIRHELKDVEERFRKAMIANAQLDNERASQTYQIQLLKDKLEEMEESYAQLQREFKDKSRECNAFKRQLDKLTEELKLVQGQLNERDALIAEQGLVIVAVENDDGSDARRALVSVENAQLLGTVQGSLDVRLKKFSEEKHQLMIEVQRLHDQLENYKSYGKQRSLTNGPLSDDEYEAQREANKVISDYKYKLQKAEQEIASLQSSLARSETQVIRYKSTAEAAEKAEAELKIERRKLQRENRESMERLEELETANNHLLKRMDKLKNVKSALLKDL